MMEIIENTGARVTRVEINRPPYWWEKEEMPEGITCHIQELSEDGAVNLYLSFSILSKIMDMALEEKNKMQDAWLNPTTDCCETKMPRENTQILPYADGEGSMIICKPGYGCKAKEEAKQ